MASELPTVRLSKKKFANTLATPYSATKDALGITLGIFFDQEHLYQPVHPFWMTFGRRMPIGLCLEKMCKKADIPNTNNLATPEEEKWHVFCLTSATGVPMEAPLHANNYVEQVASNGDIWYVGQGPEFPAGLKEEALERMKKISSRTPASDVPEGHQKHESNANPKASKAAASASPNKFGHLAEEASKTSLTILVCFAELDDRVMTIVAPHDAPVADVIAAIKQLEPEATKSGIRLMFCDKYVRSEKESIRSVPLMDGSTVVACTGKYLSENEMTLYLGSSKLKEVRKAVEEHPERPIDRNLKMHWNELLMKALMQLDSLQEVPDDIRLRRKALVKEVMAEQDVLLAIK